MNVFQQVFASIDSKGSEHLFSSANSENVDISNNVKPILKNTKQSSIKNSPKYSSSKQTISSKLISSENKSKNELVRSQPKRNVQSKRLKPKTEEQPIIRTTLKEGITVDRKTQKEKSHKLAELEEQILMIENKIKKVEKELSTAQKENEELIQINENLESKTKQMKKAEAESKQKLLDTKLDLEEKEFECTDSWKFRINELKIELESLS